MWLATEGHQDLAVGDDSPNTALSSFPHVHISSHISLTKCKSLLKTSFHTAFSIGKFLATYGRKGI
jgi:hypothetical protein